MDKEIRLPPGFRFHPTDEELVVQYLRRKVLCCPLSSFIIPEIELSRYDPWDLPGGRSGEKERYFFNFRNAKYRKGSRSNRATASGYWKATGKDKEIIASRGSRVVGMKKVLVFYRGKASHGSRTDWIMHEYRLSDITGMAGGSLPLQISSSTSHSPKLNTVDWVLCRIFQKKRVSSNGEMDMDRHENSQTIHRGILPFIDSIAHDDGETDSAELSCVTENSDGSRSDDESSCS